MLNNTTKINLLLRCREKLSRLSGFAPNFSTSSIVRTNRAEKSKKLKCALIPGDGVGPELVYAVQDIVKGTGSEVYHTKSSSIDDVLEVIRRNNNVALKGVIQSAAKSETDGINMELRNKLDLFANVVHIKTLKGIKTRHDKELDILIIREQTEGEYSRMEHELVPGVIECLKIMTRTKCMRIAKFAFDYATKFNRKKVTAVHKANIMKLGDGLFLNICNEVSGLYPRIKFENMIIDNCCMQLVNRPEQFDVMVMPNLYGNIIDNLAAGLVGGAGVVPGMSLGSDYVVFEPGSRHTFKEAFGRQIANPTAMILCCANMLNHLHLTEHSMALRIAVERVVAEGKVRTRDLGGYSSTSEFVAAIIENFKL